MDDVLIDFLSNTTIFKKVDRKVIAKIASKLKPIHLNRSEILFRQSDLSSCLYFILSGRLRLSRKLFTDENKMISEYGRGDVIGDIALIIDEPRFATAKAVTDCQLLELDKETYEQYSDKFPKEMLAIAKNAVFNLYQSTVQGVKKTHRSLIISITPAGDNVDIDKHTKNIISGLEKIGPTLHLDKKHFESLFKLSYRTETLNEIPSETLLRWRYRLEEKYQYIVFETDPTLTVWTRWCLEQAEKILSVGKGNGKPDLNEIECRLFSDPKNLFGNTELVLFHDPNISQPSNTRVWFKDRHLHGINHIRLNNKNDLDRLARLITNHCNCLVLSGGGARGIAHVGVLKAFEKSGIPIDVVGGTSMGSVIAGLYAKNGTYSGVEIDVLKLANAGTLLDYTLPWVAMTKGKKITNRLKNAFSPDLRIEDLWMKFFAIATNIMKSNIEVLTRGLLWKSIRASTSLPGIFPPVYQEEIGILVDGAVLNSLPIDIMRGLVPDGCIIATRVTSPNQAFQFHPMSEVVSGWNLLWNNLNPWVKSKKVINIATLLINALTISSTHLEDIMSKQANVCFEINTSEFDLLDLKAASRIIDMGYETTMRKIEEKTIRDSFYT